MPGGPKEAYDLIEPIIMKCAAQVDGEPCTGYCGPIGAGNYVKMVHNGIEYGDMQLIGECYDILKVGNYSLYCSTINFSIGTPVNVGCPISFCVLFSLFPLVFSERC